MAIFEGQSLDLEVLIRDDDGNPEDLTALADYQITLYFPNGNVIDKYRRVPAPGFLEILPLDEVNGLARVLVEPDRMAEIGEGKMTVDVKILGTDAAFADGQFRLVDSGIVVDDVEDSPSKDDLLPV